MTRRGVALLVAALAALPWPAAIAGPPVPEGDAPAAGAFPDALGPPPDDLAGVRIGETRASIDARFDLRGLVPFQDAGAERYVIDPDVASKPAVRDDLESRDVRRLEFRLRDGRVDWVRIELAGRGTEMFDDAGDDLFRHYGVPTQVQERGPMQVGRAHGVRLYYWIRLWTWDWGERRLVVQGEHYGDDKREEKPVRHSYTYTLERPATVKETAVRGSGRAGSR